MLVCFVHIYGKSNCLYCVMAERLFSGCGVKYVFHDISIDHDRERVEMLLENEDKKLRTVPQIFVCDKYVGGYDNVSRMKRDKSLQTLFVEKKIKYKCK
ncbi:MAG: glutaredoxin [Alphaproteobacteria bacterium]|nr:glutaredoxin [Rickettsiales bacterium]